jgi:hypothetical protein
MPLPKSLLSVMAPVRGGTHSPAIRLEANCGFLVARADLADLAVFVVNSSCIIRYREEWRIVIVDARNCPPTMDFRPKIEMFAEP